MNCNRQQVDEFFFLILNYLKFTYSINYLRIQLHNNHKNEDQSGKEIDRQIATETRHKNQSVQPRENKERQQAERDLQQAEAGPDKKDNRVEHPLRPRHIHGHF